MNSISIIIPCYNEEFKLQTCLQALVPQLQPGDEILVVDNNSLDSTKLVARMFSGVKVLEEYKQGQVYAQAAGFNAAKNHILARIDADTIVADGWLERIRTRFNSSGHQAVTGPGLSYDLVLRTIPTMIMGFWTFRTNKLLSGHYPLWGSNFAITKTAWHAVQPHMRMRRDIWEDFEMGVELSRLGIAIDYDPKLVVGYSNRNVAYVPLRQSIAYQYRAAKTYYVCGYKLKAALSAAERTLMMITVLPVFLLEFVLQVALGYRGFNLGKPAIDPGSGRSQF